MSSLYSTASSSPKIYFGGGPNNIVADKNHVFELRTYSIKPEQLSEFVALTKENMQHKTKYDAKLRGAWVSELGPTNQFVQLWEFESLDKRAAIRKQLDSDKEWTQYLKQARPMIITPESIILKQFPWSKLNLPQDHFENKQVWELRTYQTKPGLVGKYILLILMNILLYVSSSCLGSETFQKGFGERSKYSSPSGVFFSEVGKLNVLVHLWPYDNFEHRTNVRDEALKNDTWRQTVTDTMPLLDNMESKTLLPVSFPKL
ncbi:hypothetical protein DFA_11061 [Cavenderia fasciculata]|uniref:NIPSNAP domain-containing protein n=1 Tax=Cavenderia fasciculata TaxID=261658 RepID=F4QEN9_CACFS|nr:uncharacterized protein DFA_11061 [Cavenderia fasciculata]EGG13300.1 hypothetical protein DFA_11061 [Cavenderia fasciculata]|eukprot:XP_004349999.1 hypothetical protein DFA_11061 [Cavenderia fasciculata]